MLLETVVEMLHFGKYIISVESKLNIAGEYIIREITLTLISKQILKSLERVFLELNRQHDTSVRAMAADIILQHQPSEEFLKALFHVMTSHETRELNTLLLGRVSDLARKDEHLQKVGC